MAKPVSRMNLKPVLGENPTDQDPMKVLGQLKSELSKRIKAKIEETGFSQRAKLAFTSAVQIKIQARSLLIMTSHPGFLPMIKGRLQGQMTWLVKARAPIPIITDEGELIFRSATPKSMSDGKWIHPGRAPSDFIERAKKETRDFMKAKLGRVLLKQVKAAIKKSGG